MATITNTNTNYATASVAYNNTSIARTGYFSRFINWCEDQERFHFGWVAGILAGHGCVMTPITMFAIVLSGNSMFFWVLALAAMCTSLVTNLAAMSTKVTIPVFFASILLDLTIIGLCLAHGFDISGTYI
jgi:hypothetical protein